MKKNISILLSFLLLLSMIFTGCKGKEVSNVSSGPKVNKSRVYRELGSWTKPPLYQCNQFGAGGIGYPASEYVFDSLYKLVKGTEKLVPRMADGLPKHDGDKMTVKIKPGIKWNDGELFTSKDVWAYFILNNGCEIMKYLKDIQIPDDNTVVFVFNDPAPALSVQNDLLGQEWCGTIPYHYYKEYVDKAAALLKSGKPASDTLYRGPLGLDLIHDKNLSDALNNNWQQFIKKSPKTPIGTGAFSLKTVTASDMILIKNKSYYDVKNIYFDTLEFKQVTDPAGQYAMLKNGQLDRFDGTPPKDILESILSANKNLIHYRNFDCGDIGFVWNIRKYPLNDVSFRRAITYIFDRNKIKDVGNYYGVPTKDYSIMGMTYTSTERWVSQDVKDKMTKFSHDPDKAAQLLEELGWKKGSDGIYKDKNGKTYNFVMAAPSNWVPAVNSQEVCAEQMTAFGLPAKMMAVDSSIVYTNANNGKYDSFSDWVDVTWQYDTAFYPLTNFYETSEAGYIGFPKDNTTGWNSLKAKGPDGSTIDVGKTLHDMIYMNDDEQKKAAGDLVYIASENAYGLDWFQNVSGTWWNMNTLKFKDGWPMGNQIKKYNRDMPLPTDPDLEDMMLQMNTGYYSDHLMFTGQLMPN